MRSGCGPGRRERGSERTASREASRSDQPSRSQHASGERERYTASELLHACVLDSTTAPPRVLHCQPCTRQRHTPLPLTVCGALQRLCDFRVVNNVGLDAVAAPLNLQNRRRVRREERSKAAAGGGGAGGGGGGGRRSPGPPAWASCSGRMHLRHSHRLREAREGRERGEGVSTERQTFPQRRMRPRRATGSPMFTAMVALVRWGSAAPLLCCEPPVGAALLLYKTPAGVAAARRTCKGAAGATRTRAGGRRGEGEGPTAGWRRRRTAEKGGSIQERLNGRGQSQRQVGLPRRRRPRTTGRALPHVGHRRRRPCLLLPLEGPAGGLCCSMLCWSQGCRQLARQGAYQGARWGRLPSPASGRPITSRVRSVSQRESLASGARLLVAKPVPERELRGIEPRQHRERHQHRRCSGRVQEELQQRRGAGEQFRGMKRRHARRCSQGTADVPRRAAAALGLAR